MWYYSSENCMRLCGTVPYAFCWSSQVVTIGFAFFLAFRSISVSASVCSHSLIFFFHETFLNGFVNIFILCQVPNGSLCKDTHSKVMAGILQCYGSEARRIARISYLDIKIISPTQQLLGEEAVLYLLHINLDSTFVALGHFFHTKCGI